MTLLTRFVILSGGVINRTPVHVAADEDDARRWLADKRTELTGEGWTVVQKHSLCLTATKFEPDKLYQRSEEFEIVATPSIV